MNETKLQQEKRRAFWLALCLLVVSVVLLWLWMS